MSPLAFAPHVDVTPVEDRGVVVLHARGHEVFAGAEYAAVARAVDDGTRGEDEVLRDAAGDIPAADLRRALDEFRSAGVVAERDAALGPAEAAYWARERQSPAAVAEKLSAASVAMAVAGAVDPGPLTHALAASGLRIADDGDPLLVLTDDYLRPELGGHNDEALESGRPWMLAAPEAAEILVGPVFLPDRGGCWECLAQRLRRHRHIEHYLAEADGGETPIVRPGASLPATRTAAAAIVAGQVAHWLATGRSARQAGVLSVDPRTWQTATHALTRRPQCAACGFPDVSLDRPAVAPAIGATASKAGGRALRSVAPEMTVERFEHHVSPITGAVSRLESARRPPFHVYIAGDARPRVHGEAHGWTPGATTMPGGKGPTDAQARASALCEALERYSGEFTGEESRRMGTLADVPGALHPNDCMGFSAAQYARREELNDGITSLRTFVPLPFDPDAEIAWTPLWSLTAARERLLPTAYCYYSAHVPGHDACVADSNGNAAGNTLEEAILHGLLELIERDHVALWWYNRVRRPAVDLTSVADTWLDRVRAHFAGEGRRLWALDLTADLGVPVVAALASEGDGSGVRLGYGADPDLGMATVRAVTELVQLGASVPSGGAGHGPTRTLDVASHPYLRPAADLLPVEARSGNGDVNTSLDDCRSRIEGKGLEVLVLDQTRPDIGLPVVKVVVPGMRHFWRRLGPGRLYDVPVELGWVTHACAEDEFNPVPPNT